MPAHTIDTAPRNRTITTAIALCTAALLLAGCQTTSTSTHASMPDGLALSAKEVRTLKKAKTAFEKDSFGLAQKHFKRATDLNQNNSAAWLGLAAAYDKLGEFNHADTAYQQVVRLRGTTALVLNNMAYSQLLRGNKKEAQRLLQEAKRLAPDNRHVMGNMLLAKKSA